MTKVNPRSLTGKVDNYIIENIVTQLSANHVLIDTGWVTSDDPAIKQLDHTKIAVCYSGIDGENTGCIPERLNAHEIIKNNSKSQIHIGNSNGKYYFSYWVEFISQLEILLFIIHLNSIVMMPKLMLNFQMTFLVLAILYYGISF